MEKFENFVDEYLEIAKEGLTLIFDGVRQIAANIFWLIFGSLLVVFLFPFWLIGKRERHLTQRAADFATPWAEMNAALKKFADLMNEVNKSQSR